jgi:DNA-directed RNA polymerase subunit RPC12/RpoP
MTESHPIQEDPMTAITHYPCPRCGTLLGRDQVNDEGVNACPVCRSLSSDPVLAAYVECALWSSVDDDGVPLDSNYGVEDIAPEALEKMRSDVEDFLAPSVPFTEAALDFWASELGPEQIGHDFWLTRNRHGSGFWDRFSRGDGEAFGRQLTEEADCFGSSDLYVGDDGKLYLI